MYRQDGTGLLRTDRMDIGETVIAVLGIVQCEGQEGKACDAIRGSQSDVLYIG
jgi:hypothetical protein